MTNKEAIAELKNYHYEDTDEVPKEITLAIKALKQIDLIKFNVHALKKLIQEVENETDN